MGIRFGQGLQVVPILAPADIASTTTKTNFVDLKTANWATLAVHFGVITCDPVVVTVKCSTAATTVSAINIAFKYRLTSGAAANQDAMGAITDATTTGATIAVTDDDKLLLIDVDPAAVAAEGTDYRYLHALLTSECTVLLVGVTAFLEPRYPGNTIAAVLPAT